MDNRLCRISGWCLEQFYGINTDQVNICFNNHYLPEFKELLIYVPDFDYPVVETFYKEQLQC